jgi:hypothetical protein
MYRILLILALVMVLCYTGCSEDSDTPIAPPQDTVTLYTKDDTVIAHVYIVRDAVEAFAAANNGVYPHLTTWEGVDGQTLIDLLPDGKYLVNPYWGVMDSPMDGSSAMAGQVGYMARDVDADGAPDGYVIDALGADGATILITLYYDPREP